MLMYYTINTLLVVFGAVFFMIGGVTSFVSLGNHKVQKDWIGISIGLAVMVVGIGFWWFTGSVYLDGFKPPPLGE